MADVPVVDNKVIPPPKTADQIFDLLNDDTDDEVKEPVRREPKVKEPESEEEPEKKAKDIEDIEDEEDLELKEPEEEAEKLDLEEESSTDDIQVPPRKKEILKAYPDIFKKFPFLEKMMYRDREYTQLFGSYDNAKEVADRVESVDNLEAQLMSGNTEDLLKTLKSTDEKAFNMVVDDYLQTLLNVDKDSYFHVVNNMNKRLIMEMWTAGSESGDDNLKEAAIIINKFLFASAKFTGPTRRVEKTEKSEKSEAETERITFLRERFEEASDRLQTTVDNTLNATISEYIDSKGQMSSYVKKNAVADAIKYIKSALGKSPEVAENLNRLWKAATEDRFSSNSLDRVKSYYLSRAKRVIKQAIIKARTEALKDLPAKNQREQDEEPAVDRQQRRLSPGRPNQNTRKENGMRKGESVADFFARD